MARRGDFLETGDRRISLLQLAQTDQRFGVEDPPSNDADFFDEVALRPFEDGRKRIEHPLVVTSGASQGGLGHAGVNGAADAR